jgi:HEAT repeat protein
MTISSIPKNNRAASSCSTSLMAMLITSLLMLGCSKGGSGSEDKAARALDALNSASTTAEKIGAIGQLKDVSSGAGEKVGAKAVEMLQDGEAEVRKAALDLIAVMKHKDAAAVTALGGLVKNDADLDVKKQALATLHSIGAADEHVKLAKEALAGSDEEMQEYAAFQLSEAGAAAEPALAELEAALESESYYTRMYAAMALGNLGSKAASAKAKLEALTSDKEVDVAAAAKEALGKIQ